MNWRAVGVSPLRERIRGLTPTARQTTRKRSLVFFRRRSARQIFPLIGAIYAFFAFAAATRHEDQEQREQ